MLARLTEMTRDDLRLIERASQAHAYKVLSEDGIPQCMAERYEKLRESVDDRDRPEFMWWEFTFCLDWNRPERIFAVSEGDCFFPLWFDRDHLLYKGTGAPGEFFACTGANGCHHDPSILGPLASEYETTPDTYHR